MRVLRGPVTEWKVPEPHGVAVGVFDGIHRGHVHVLEQLLDRCAQMGVAPAVLTFDPHPVRVLAPDRAPRLLTTIDQRIDLLEDLGIELVAVLEFTPAIRAMTASSFISEILVDRLAARLIVAGTDFRFGAGREGDVAMLSKMGPDLGYEVVASPLIGDDDPVSSTRIRSLLATGDVAAAAALLGRDYELRATIAGVSTGVGAARARLAFPGGLAHPGPGTYAVVVDDAPAVAVVSDAGIGVIGVTNPVEGTEMRVVFQSRMGAE